LGCGKSSFKKEVYSNTGLSQHTRELSNNLNLHLKELEKEQTPKLAESRRKEIIKTIAEISEKLKTNKTKKEIELVL